MEILIIIASIIIILVGLCVILFAVIEDLLLTFLGGMTILFIGIGMLSPDNKPSLNSEKQRKQELLKELKEIEKNKSLYKLKTENDKLEDSIRKIKEGL